MDFCDTMYIGHIIVYTKYVIMVNKRFHQIIQIVKNVSLVDKNVLKRFRSLHIEMFKRRFCRYFVALASNQCGNPNKQQKHRKLNGDEDKNILRLKTIVCGLYRVIVYNSSTHSL